MRRSSWPPLLAVAVAFLAGFVLLRGRSEFLAAEADAALVVAAARPLEVPVATALAVRAMATPAAWREALAAFARRRGPLGDALAAVAVFGDEPAATAARAGAPDAAAAWQTFRTTAAAAPGLRFLVLQERFAARAVARQ